MPLVMRLIWLLALFQRDELSSRLADRVIIALSDVIASLR
jgi:hypothetical protein